MSNDGCLFLQVLDLGVCRGVARPLAVAVQPVVPYKGRDRGRDGGGISLEESGAGQVLLSGHPSRFPRCQAGGGRVSVWLVQGGHPVVGPLGPVGHIVVLGRPAQTSALTGLQDGESQGEEDDGADAEDDGPGQVFHHCRVQQVPQHGFVARCRLPLSLIARCTLEAVTGGRPATGEARWVTRLAHTLHTQRSALAT